MSTRPDADEESTERPSNVLLLAPSLRGEEADVCRELLHGPVEDANGLLVTCLESPRDRLAAWTDHDHAETGEVAVVDVEMSARSAATADVGTSHASSAPIETVSADDDLVDLGEAIDRQLTRLTANGETAVCLHSVSDLLQHGDERGVFKFLAVLTNSVARADAVAHYHMNPDVHDPATIETLEVLFDSIVDLRTATLSRE